ncbi:TetR/AcrR family transcriptional regulator [Actinomadura rugatobispora]|uniref:TetR/AcrR family transcriptional regulator n=1 Tax=Actinomadura rugatobispora TaxID=1994 RepID=A0ABW0ZVE1_9ACTN|nr:TetR/AcrR family transcriptional regulator [Actinomadura rugatobispora]
MGQRERLLSAARRLLAERGYARTTSRDLAAAADANVASINYHYGSKEELLTAALLETVDAWGEKVVHTPGEAPPEAGGTKTGAGAAATGAERRQRFATMWKAVIESYVTDRAMIVSTIEALSQAGRLPGVREQIAAAYERSREPMGVAFPGVDPGDEQAVRAVGSVHMALVAGLSLQWLVDPENAPSADDVALGLQAMLDALRPE